VGIVGRYLTYKSNTSGELTANLNYKNLKLQSDRLSVFFTITKIQSSQLRFNPDKVMQVKA